MQILLARPNIEVLVDDEDYARLMTRTWRLSPNGYVRSEIYIGKKQVQILLHRFVMGLEYGDSRFVDHKNGIKTDNRRENLRVCNRSQNGYNRGVARSNTTGFKGVTLDKRSGRYRSQIKSDGKHIALGSFSNPEDAHQAYREAATRLHGEFCNFGENSALATTRGMKDAEQ